MMKRTEFPGVFTFDDFEDVVEYNRKVKLWNDLQMKEWQRHLKTGDHFVYEYSELTIYCEILEMPNGPEDCEIDEESYLFINAYSEVVPEGELGTCHRSAVIAKVTPDDFAWFREHGWPCIDIAERTRLVDENGTKTPYCGLKIVSFDIPKNLE